MGGEDGVTAPPSHPDASPSLPPFTQLIVLDSLFHCFLRCSASRPCSPAALLTVRCLASVLWLCRSVGADSCRICPVFFTCPSATLLKALSLAMCPWQSLIEVHKLLFLVVIGSFVRLASQAKHWTPDQTYQF